MLGFPDTKTFDVEYDDVKNLMENTNYPMHKFS